MFSRNQASVTCRSHCEHLWELHFLFIPLQDHWLAWLTILFSQSCDLADICKCPLDRVLGFMGYPKKWSPARVCFEVWEVDFNYSQNTDITQWQQVERVCWTSPQHRRRAQPSPRHPLPEGGSGILAPVTILCKLTVRQAEWTSKGCTSTTHLLYSCSMVSKSPQQHTLQRSRRPHLLDW